MTNSIAKRTLTIAVAAATILWSVGFAALVPQNASAASYGDLIKGTTLSTVYYYGSDGQRYSFPNEKTFFSWYNDFSGVVTMSDSELANITLAGNVAYRPGSRWIKITSDQKTYAVAKNGSIRWIESEAVAKGLAGNDWNQFIDDVPDVFFVDYTVGNSLTSAASAYEGALVKSGSDNYLVWGDKKLKVSADGMTANRFKSGFVLDGADVTLASLTAGSDVTSKQANLTDAAQKVTTATYETSQNVTVSMSSVSPAASTLLAGQAIASVMVLNFSNPTSSDVKVKSLELKRTGVSADTTLANVYLFDKWVRLTDAATLSSGIVSWNDSNGLFTIPAGSSSNIYVRTDIAASTNGQTLGLKLESAAKVGFVGAFAAAGSFPMSSATHTIAASPSTFGALAHSTTTTPSSAVSLDPDVDTRVWENNVTLSNNEAYLQAVRFRNTGSINAADVSNWRFYLAGVQRGSAVAKQDSQGYVSFDFSAAPIKVNTGTHAMKVLVNIVGGSTRTIIVSLRSAADIVMVDEDFDQAILATGNGTSTTATFAAHTTATQTVNGGTLTFTRTTDSPSTDVVETASNVTLAKYTVKASGEAMKVESLNFNVDPADADSDSTPTNYTAFTLRNGAVYLNGAQIGSTTAVCSNDDTSGCSGSDGSGASYTTYNFGSSFIVKPGAPATLEFKADIFDNDGTENVDPGDTLTLVIDATALSDNVYRMTTGDYVESPSADASGNARTVAVGDTTLARNAAYASQTAVDPKTQYKIGSYVLTSTTAEDINITSITADIDGSTGEEDGEITNMYIKYGPAANMVTGSVKTNPSESDAGNVWNIDYTLKSNSTIYIDVYADLDSSLDGGSDLIITTLAASGTAVSSGTTVTETAVTGQTITIGSGSFAATLDGSSAVAALYSANSTIDVGKYRFTATNEDAYIDLLRFTIGTAAIGVPSSISLYDGSTLVATDVFDETSSSSGDRVTFNTLNFKVPANTYKVLTAKLALSNVGTGAAATQQNVALTLARVEYKNSEGVLQTAVTSFTTAATNEANIVKSFPTVNHVDLTNSTLVNGQATDLYKFTVTANSAGSIAIKQMKFPISFTDADADTIEVESWKLYKNGADVSTGSSTVVIEKQDGTSIESTSGVGDATFTGGSDDTTVVVMFDTDEEVIGAGETVTYVLRATPVGFDSDGDTGDEDYFTIYLAGDSSDNGSDLCLEDSGSGNIWELDAEVSSACTAASSSNSAYNFVWSDISGASHNAGTETGSADWANGYLVKNLDLSGETWAK